MWSALFSRRFLRTKKHSDCFIHSVDKKSARMMKNISLPSFVDLSPWMAPVKDQGRMNIW